MTSAAGGQIQGQQRSVEVFDSPIIRRPAYTSLPRPVQCAMCNRAAYCKVVYDLGQVIKLEFLCRECCRRSIGNTN